MSKFVSDEKIACVQTAAGELLALGRGAYLDYARALPEAERESLNVIWIAARMGFARQRAVLDALIDVENRAKAEGGPTMGLNFGAHQVALLRHNILGWEGPDLGATPLTQANIDRLDPDDALVAFALAEIARRNPTRSSPDPKSAGAPGSSSAGAPPSTASSEPTSLSATSTSM